jgi:hypothetical protein
MKSILLASACALALSGCATITRGTSNQVQLRSNPEEARATTSMGQSCQTPCTITVGRKDEFAVRFEKEGFETQSVEVKTQLAGTGAAGFAGNVLIGGVIGMGADVVTGATLEHIPNPVQVDLVPLRKIEPPRPAQRSQKRPRS